MLEINHFVANQLGYATLSAPTLGLVLGEEERKERLAYWISDTMRRRKVTPPKVAASIVIAAASLRFVEARFRHRPRSESRRLAEDATEESGEEHVVLLRPRRGDGI
jgi:hypothetical protein